MTDIKNVWGGGGVLKLRDMREHLDEVTHVKYAYKYASIDCHFLLQNHVLNINTWGKNINTWGKIYDRRRF